MQDRSSPTLQGMDYYASKFKQKTGKRYLPNYGRDGTIIKSILKNGISIDELKHLLDVFFESTDNFTTQSGYSLPVFKYRINELVAGGGYKDGEEEAYFTIPSRQVYVRRNYIKYKDIKKHPEHWDADYMAWATEFEKTITQYPRMLRDLEKFYDGR